MSELVTQETLAEFEAFVCAHPKGHFLQSHKWSAVKGSWKWEGLLSRDAHGCVRGALSVLIRRVPVTPFTLMYGARGPVCDSHDRAALADLTEGARVLAKKHNAYALRLDPDISNSDTEFVEVMKGLGYRHQPGNKNFEGVQPCYVFRLDVRNKTEDDLLGAFAQKTRYNLRLSERKGVSVKLCGEEALPDFARLMRDTGNRDGFIVRGEDYFRALLQSLGEDARLYMAYWEGKPIAGTLAIHFGNKVWYLYGASSNEHRNVMPNYQLQWAMIRWALETKSDIYDFRGVSGDLTPENPLYGLYLFKKGFGGELTEFCGELTMVYNKTAEALIDKGLGAVRTIRHKLATLKHKA